MVISRIYRRRRSGCFLLLLVVRWRLSLVRRIIYDYDDACAVVFSEIGREALTRPACCVHHVYYDRHGKRVQKWGNSVRLLDVALYSFSSVWQVSLSLHSLSYTRTCLFFLGPVFCLLFLILVNRAVVASHSIPLIFVVSGALLVIMYKYTRALGAWN